MMILVYVVCANVEEAKRISSFLLEQRLAACTNMYPIKSAYWWEGKIVEDDEVVMIAKTVAGNFDVVKEAVLKLHSYQVPCVMSIPVDRIESKYLQWLQGEIR